MSNTLPTGPAAGTRSASDVDAIAALALKGQFPAQQIRDGNHVPAYIWPDKSITTHEQLCERPRAKRGNAALADVPSFVAYVKRHETPGTLIAGDYSEQGGHFAAQLDHHEPNPVMPPDLADKAKGYASAAGWAEHSARVDLKATPEWERWLKATKEPMSQTEFALFLEENADDVVVPDNLAEHGIKTTKPLPSAAELNSVALTLQVNSDVRFNSAIRLSDGNTELRYSEAVNGTYGTAEQKLAVPDLFCIAVSPFQGAPKFVVQVRLRYRAAGGKAAFALQLVRPHKVVETAWLAERARIEEQTGHQVLRGSITTPGRKISG
jgi:uncharacterized protein YfdQ (DUF2303 family)